jgi:putative polyhydroxyalkanoate system protein
VADLHILREHTLGLTEARKIAFKWAEHAEEEFGMTCTYEEGVEADEVCFTRSGVSGNLAVSHDKFELSAKLGFLLGAFKGRIESEIVKNLDDLLAPKKAVKGPSKTAAKPHVTPHAKSSAKAAKPRATPK